MSTQWPLAPAAWCMSAVVLASPGAVLAEEYPTRPIELMVPYPAGGLVDIAARVLGERVRESLGQPMVVVNRPGASSMIGTNAVVRAKPDGHTLLLTTSTLTINAALSPKLVTFDVLTDLAAIAIVATTSQILVVPASVPAASVKELIALARERPGKLTYGSAGVGTPAHLAGEQLRALTGVNMLHVPYNGAPPAMNALLAGDISLMFANPAVAAPQIRAGKIRALAVASPNRSALVPEVPTMAETGLPLNADNWIGFFAPRGTPSAAIQRVTGALHKALAVEDVKATLARSGMLAVQSSTPASFAAFLRQDIDRHRAIARDGQIKVD
jgi:tripartite-type tricarboxylate transporter receptor subunit TctC